MLGLVVLHDEVWQVLLVNGLAGFGIGFVFSSLAPLILAAVPAHQSGAASGMNANIRTIGGSLGSAVMTGIVVGHVGASGLPSEGGYTIGFLVLAGAMLLAALAAVFIPDIHDQPDDGPEESPGRRDGLAAPGSAEVGDLRAA